MMLQPISVDLMQFAPPRPQRLRWLLVSVAVLLALAAATAGGCA